MKQHEGINELSEICEKNLATNEEKLSSTNFFGRFHLVSIGTWESDFRYVNKPSVVPQTFTTLIFFCINIEEKNTYFIFKYDFLLPDVINDNCSVWWCDDGAYRPRDHIG